MRDGKIYCKWCGKRIRLFEGAPAPYWIHVDDDFIYCFGGVLPSADPLLYNRDKVVVNIDPARPDVSPVFRRGTSG